MLNTAYEKPKRPTALDLERRNALVYKRLYFGCPDIDSTFLYLLDQGLALKNQKQLVTVGTLNLTDPEDYKLCFHYPTQNIKKIIIKIWCVHIKEYKSFITAITH